MMTMTPDNIRQKPKHVPQRTCLACRQVKPKRELIRLVRTTSGTIEIDNNGKIEGRGAYLCTNPACWDTIIRGNQLEHAFRVKVKQENREALAARGKTL